MGRIVSLLIGITFIFASSEEGDIGFRYGFLSKPTHESKDITILSDSSIIHTGDQLQINIGYAKGTNFSVIYKSAEDEYMLLFPNADDIVKISKNNLDTLNLAVLNWTKMENPPGFETFYFINSIESLSELLELLTRYDNAPLKGKAKLSHRIKNKIDSLNPDAQDDISSISSQLDRPVTGGVSFRGEDEDGLKDLSVTHECLGSGGIAFQKIVLIHQ